jgi:mannose-6-phosphate isomerase-like protein (cupin superfamily)
VISLDEALSRLAAERERPFAELFRHGTLSVEIFAPRGVDTQTPHRQDEIYVVIKGTGEFSFGSQRRRVGAGDLLFVPAGMEHRFEAFSPDLTLWVMFHGPEGGERP